MGEVTLDAVSEQRLSEVCPLLASKIRQMAGMVTLDPLLFRVTQGLRTWAEQEALYEQGRQVSGRIVTDAPPGATWHNFGLAVDIVPMTTLGPDWNKTHPVWQRLLAVGNSLGLTEGATFRSFPDWPHFQLTGTFPVSPNNEVRQIFTDGGMISVWRTAFPDATFP